MNQPRRDAAVTPAPGTSRRPRALRLILLIIALIAGAALSTASAPALPMAAPAVPTVTGLTPKSGPPAGGTVVRVRGTGFTPASTVLFGTRPGTRVTYESPRSLVVTAPAAPAGPVQVRVQTAAGLSPVTVAGRYVYVAPPAITAVSPARGPAAGGTTVTISGRNFVGVRSVTFGTAAAGFTVTSATSLTAVTPAGTGAVDIRITATGGTSAVVAAGRFTYEPGESKLPVITAVSPVSGPVAGGTSVTITGAGFDGATLLTFGWTKAASFTVVSGSEIRAVTPPGPPETVPVAVSTPVGTSAASPAATFSYASGPVITDLTPATGPVAGGTSVTITGTGLDATTSVLFGAVASPSVTVTSATSVTAVTPPHAAGVVDVVLTTPDGSSPPAAFTFTEVDEGAGQVVVAGSHHSCALDDQGAVSCWGWNDHGQLGDGTTTSRNTPVAVPGLDAGVLRLAAGGASTCAVLRDQSVRCWGWNSFGQLGDGTTTDRRGPTLVPGLEASDITVGNGHACAIRRDSTLACWGWNFYGQLGTGSTASQKRPVVVAGLNGVTKVSGGDQHTCAVVAGGAARCWGANTAGQLGDGSRAQRSSPTAVPGLDTGVTAISAGVLHTCAIRDGAPWCWGRNNDGQVGDGTTTDRQVPARVAIAGGAAALIDADGSSCAVAGTLQCWGANDSGAVGDGSTASRSTPTEVQGLPSPPVSIANGADHTCAATADGALWCWGENGTGQLGDGTTQDRRTATPVTPGPGSGRS